MFIRRIELRDFRSWPELDIELGPGITVFVGRNGYGKTNILEALHYLTTLSSHRVSTDQPLFRAGCNEARAAAGVVNAGRELTVGITLRPGRRPNLAEINGAPRRPREILGVLHSVLFAPEDLALVRGEPAERRRFLDELATLRRPLLAGIRADYDKVVRQRNALLKSLAATRGADAAGMSTLDVWDSHLAQLGARLTGARLELLAELAPRITEAYATLAPESRTARVRYRTSFDEEPWEAVGAIPEADHLEALLLAELGRSRPRELARALSLVGPHRDDLVLDLGDQPAKGYASHGESWSYALSLRLASFRLLAESGGEPVLLLDDVFAELDRRRRRALAEFAAGVEQVLVTAAADEDIPPELCGRRLVVEVRETGGGRVSILDTGDGSAEDRDEVDGVTDDDATEEETP